MPALGRPFKLGMLYDARADKLVPGMTLWDHEKLQQDMTETLKPNSEFEMLASDSISDKSNSLGVDASLKASFFSGLITVDGSAKYLKDTKTSKQQARVTLQYKTTTCFRALTMNQLGGGNIMHPDVFEKGLATHVVTAILYGAQAFFVFDREVSDSENLQDVQGNLQVIIKKIPCISIEGEGALKMEDKDKEKVQKFSCKFHGDFSLSQNPVTFEDAMKVYQDLPKLLGPNGEKAVPVKVWLLPLTSLDSAAARLVRQVSVGLVFEVERTLEHLEDLDMRCRDVLNSTELKQFPQIVTKIRTFMGLCSEFKLGLQGVLAQKLPSIRGGGEEEAELAEILRKRAASPFSHDCLNQWVRCKVKEAKLIKTFCHLMKNTEVLSSQDDLDDRSSNVKNTVCFVFTSLETEEPYLSALSQYLKGSEQLSPRPKDLEMEQWYSDKDVREAVRTKAKLFGDFAEANSDNQDVKFLAVAFKDENYKGSTIYLYEEGFEVSDNFEPPSKPENISVDDVTHNSLTLHFSAPTWGAETVTGYRLEYSDGGEWQLSEAQTGLVKVSALSADTEYSFRLRAVTAVGLGPAAELKSIKTAPKRLTEELKKTCEVLETKGSLQILKLPLTRDSIEIPGCQQFIYGIDFPGKSNCTIMLMGATGAGKSTLINGMINYILGVQWTDPYRFKLVVEEEKSQAQSQTSEVTVYKINFDHGFMIDYSLTIIDTPGFGNTRGIKRDQQITEQIRKLFSNNFGVNDIHAMCFVAQSALPRLSATQRYVFDSVLSIFGNDVAKNIRVLVTFADGQLPPVLEAITVAGVPCPKADDGKPAHYKFNNSALFAENQSSVVGFDEMFWNMGKASMRSFFDALHKTEPKSLTRIKEVLRERKQLEETVEDLQRKIKVALAKQDEIKQTEEQMKTAEEIKKKYVISKLKEDYHQFKDNVTDMVQEATKALNCLSQIALKPNPLSTPDYIHLLIESEKKQRELG
ncbi:verrucotoxin subunit beta-like, partial [Periophthalmus magnuspinnatus]|uniref:verrucotoxin subunit beta-like n=1 Tax=Periophthalmus magnuspinnatus TaxID=409849 RepID=UPI0024367E9D